jgi:hypothetical protein
MDRAAFLDGLLGTPYDKAERHCWWLVSLVERELFGRSLPAVDNKVIGGARERARIFAGHNERTRWVDAPQPRDGSIAMMSKNRLHDVHCGVYLLTPAGGRILHTDAPHGVVFDSPAELTHARGWRVAYLESV